MGLHLLVVEDDRLLQEAVSDYFGSKEWQVTTVGHGDQVPEVLAGQDFQLILLDVMLPGTNGFALCREIRAASNVPVIFITARAMEEDELTGYALGADDYVTKPFSLPVLYAKAMALMGRVRGKDPVRRLVCGDIQADIRTHQVWIGERICELPPKEYEMLLFFMENPNRVFSREQLLVRFWGYDFDGNERVVDNHVKKLRKAMGTCGCVIKTVRKSGYCMEVAEV